jgi:hypothetical protein
MRGPAERIAPVTWPDPGTGPARRPGARGWPAWKAISGSRAASRRALPSRSSPVRRRAMAAGRSAHSDTRARSPVRATWAWTGPMGSTSSEKRARQVRPKARPPSPPEPPPSRLISNWAAAGPCGVMNGMSNTQRWACSSTGRPAAGGSGSEAICSSSVRARAAPVSVKQALGDGVRAPRRPAGPAGRRPGRGSGRRHRAAGSGTAAGRDLGSAIGHGRRGRGGAPGAWAESPRPRWPRTPARAAAAA